MAHYKRITKREIVKGPDEFVGFWTKAYYWGADNIQTILAYALGAVAVVLLGAGFVFYRQNAETSASGALFKILRDAPMTGGERKPEDIAKITDTLGSFADKNSGTQTGRQALLMRASLLDHKKNPGEAEKIYKRLLDGKQDVMAHIACLGLAAEYQNEGKFTDAVALLGKYRQNSFFEEEMDFMLARNLELSGNKAEAAKEYKKFTEKYPNSNHAGDVKESLAKVS